MRVRFLLDSQFIHENNYRTMKISFKVDDVLPMVLQAASVVNPKSPIPILTSLVIKTRKKTGNATVTASDSNTWIDMLMPLVGEEKGDDFAFTVNSKDFVAALKNLSGKTVTLELNEEYHIAKVIDGPHPAAQFTGGILPEKRSRKGKKPHHNRRPTLRRSPL